MLGRADRAGDVAWRRVFRPLRCFRPALLLTSVLAAASQWGGCELAEDLDSVQAPGLASGIQFTEVTVAAGLGAFVHDNGAAGDKYYAEQMGSGGGWLDYDGDGWLDVLLMGGGQWDRSPKAGYRALWLYRNLGGGTFVDRTEEAGLAEVVAYTIGMAAADYDNDGDTDFLLTSLNHNMLFRNDAGVFIEVGGPAGLSNEDEWSSSALWLDSNRDGWLDVYVGNYANWAPERDKFCPEGAEVKLYCVPADYQGMASRFYLGGPDGVFSDVTREAGVFVAYGKALGMAEFDYNRDGWSDFVVANDGEGDLLFHNRGDGTFEERGVISGVAFSEHGEARAGMGIDIGVVDETGEPSIFVGNFSEEMIGVYRHMGNGLFLDRAASSRIGQPSLNTLAFGLFLFDVDLDGDLDLFSANGHVYPDRLVNQDKITYRQRSQVFENVGEGRFEEFAATEGSPLTVRMVARGAAYADYDKDGDVDILITENDGPAHLWRNDHVGHGFLRFAITPRWGNRDGLGTRIVILAEGRRQERRVRGGSSYLSQSELAVTFGLGVATQADSAWVYWPSGSVTALGPLEANQEVHVVESDL